MFQFPNHISFLIHFENTRFEEAGDQRISVLKPLCADGALQARHRPYHLPLGVNLRYVPAVSVGDKRVTVGQAGDVEHAPGSVRHVGRRPDRLALLVILFNVPGRAGISDDDITVARARSAVKGGSHHFRPGGLALEADGGNGFGAVVADQQGHRSGLDPGLIV